MHKAIEEKVNAAAKNTVQPEEVTKFLQTLYKQQAVKIDTSESEADLSLHFTIGNYTYVKTFKKCMEDAAIYKKLSGSGFPVYILDMLKMAEFDPRFKSHQHYLSLVKHFPQAFIIGGPTGIGKTFAVVQAVWELCRTRLLYSPAFAHPADIKRIWNKERNDSFIYDDNDLVIIDDLGVEGQDDYSKRTKKMVEQFSDSRLKWNQKVWFTTNISSASDLENEYGKRFITRLNEHGVLVFEADYDDRHEDKEEEELPF